jgi:mannose-1-phosphate guanylyltransferase
MEAKDSDAVGTTPAAIEGKPMNAVLDHSFAVVLAGGSGTRLWPMSRDGLPKQFLKLGGNRTLLQQSVDRILPLISPERVIVVTNKEYEAVVREQLPEIDPRNIIAEPEKRDTALAMAAGSLLAKKRDPEAVVTNLASDHVISNTDECRRILQAALEIAAEKQHLLTVGIRPTGPNVNFGYIQVSSEKQSDKGVDVYPVLRFKEKPDLETAQSFLTEGNYYWNANMYTWHVDTMLAAFEKYQPGMMPSLHRISEAFDTDQQTQVLAETYAGAEKISIDYAISEHADNLRLIPGDFGWEDIGLWSTVYDLGAKDENGQVIVQGGADSAPVVGLNAHNNLVATNGRLVALVGVSDLVVVDSEGVLLILPREQTSEVKNMVAELKERGLQEYL